LSSVRRAGRKRFEAMPIAEAEVSSAAESTLIGL
jgi:hypothetical protein